MPAVSAVKHGLATARRMEFFFTFVWPSQLLLAATGVGGEK
jgi:hypothetical protein